LSQKQQHLDPNQVNQDQLDRIERKLDMIIDHFNIGASGRARRSNQEIEAVVREKIYKLQNRQKKAAK